MKKIFIVMESSNDHDAYDSFGDFLLGVELGKLGFTNLYSFHSPLDKDGEEEETVMTYFSTAPLTKEEEEAVRHELIDMRVNGSLNEKRCLEAKEKTIYLFAWYEDAIMDYKLHNEME